MDDIVYIIFIILYFGGGANIFVRRGNMYFTHIYTFLQCFLLIIIITIEKSLILCYHQLTRAHKP